MNETEKLAIQGILESLEYECSEIRSLLVKKQSICEDLKVYLCQKLLQIKIMCDHSKIE